MGTRHLALFALAVIVAGCGGSQGENEVTALEKAWQLQCMGNIRTIITALQMESTAGGGEYLPADLGRFTEEKLGTRKVLLCPDDKAAADGPRCSYQSVLDVADKKIPARLQASRHILIWDNAPRHGSGRCVGYSDASTEWLSEKDFQQELQKLKLVLNDLR